MAAVQLMWPCVIILQYKYNTINKLYLIYFKILSSYYI